MSLAVFDIGGTSVKYGLWEDDQLKFESSFLTPKTWPEMKKLLNDTFVHLSSLTSEKITGAAFSSPGSVDIEAGVVKGFSAIPYLHHFPIVSELADMFSVPVTFENDAYCAALAETWQGAARGIENAVFIVIGSGIGGAIISQGKLLKGRNLFGGEFGYMMMDHQYSFSDLASPVNTASRYSKESGSTVAISGQELFDRAQAGEALAQKHVEQMLDSLGRGIQMISVALNPDRIMLGGAISEREGLLEDVTQRAQAYLERTQATDVELDIMTCKFHNQANLIGAVSAHYSQIKQ